MSSENEDQVLLKSSDENTKKSGKKYTREFLLSFSEHKKLPSDFDSSLLSLFEEAFSSSFERQRNSGGEYGLLSQSRLESFGGHLRGGHGRWDTRSTGSTDKESDSQSGRESTVQDSGRRFGTQTRRSWQISEQDGLLGSGAFPRPAGYTGALATKGQGNGNCQLKKSNEPYQPPRPYKAMPYSKKDTDLYNDETFGSLESSSEDRAEEERKRRASFELMRKEQQKALQEKNKVNLGIPKENLDADIVALLGNSVENGIENVSKVDELATTLQIQAPVSRPLIPPGFVGPVVEKNVFLQSSSNASALETGNSLVENKRSLISMEKSEDKGKSPPASKIANLNAPEIASHLSIDENEKIILPVSDAEVVKRTINFEKVSSKITLPEVNEIWADDIIVVNDSSCEGPSKSVNMAGQTNSTTILEKLFSSALSKKFATTPISSELQNVKADEEIMSPAALESSKFAHWFSDEEKISVEDSSSKELFSLIISNDKANEVSTTDKKFTEHIPLSSEFELTNSPPMLKSSAAPSSVILTCEEIEQSILAEVKDSRLGVNPSIQGTLSPSTNSKSEKQKAYVDDQASQHLLSLLQKGTDTKDSSSFQKPDFIEPGGKIFSSQFNISDDSCVSNPGNAYSSEKSLTLETLFGKSFMNALHSAQAPVSAQGGSSSSPSKPNNAIVGETSALNLAPQYNFGGINYEEERALEIQLPEEDSLITVADTLRPAKSEPFQFENPRRSEFLTAMLRDGEEQLTHFPSGSGQFQKSSLDMVDPKFSYHQLHGPLSSQFPHHQTDHLRSVFPPSDHHAQRNPSLTFPGNIIPHHGYNNVHTPTVDPTVAAHHTMLQHMQVPGHFPHHHPLQALPRGMPMSHSVNHMLGYMPEMNNIHNFPPHGQQPSYGGGLGMGLPGSLVRGGGGSHPEAFGRLLEMEMKAANSKQIHRPPTGAHIPGFYDHSQIDMNARYR